VGKGEMGLTNDREFKVQKGKFKGFAFLVSGSWLLVKGYWLRVKSEELRVKNCPCLKTLTDCSPFPVVMSGIQLQSSLHVNRKPVPPNTQAAEQRHVLTVHLGLQADG